MTDQKYDEQQATINRLALESNRLFEEKQELKDQVEDLTMERNNLAAKISTLEANQALNVDIKTNLMNRARHAEALLAFLQKDIEHTAFIMAEGQHDEALNILCRIMTNMGWQ